MKILYTTDIHFDVTPDKPHYPHAVEMLPVFWDFLAKNIKNYDLFVAGGDLTVKGPACIKEIKEFKNKLETITDKYIAIPGNHDLCPIKGMEETYPGVEEYEYTDIENTNFAKVFGEKGLRFSNKYDNVRLVSFAVRNEDPDGQLDWLEKQLQKPESKIVFSHYPVFQTRVGGFCSGWGYSRIGKVREKIKELLAKPENKVLLYFCGHQHINSKVPMKMSKESKFYGYQVETGTLTQATACYREIEITSDFVKVTTKQLPGVDGLAKGVMNENRSYDENHEDVMSYHFGHLSERNFKIKI